MLRGLAQYDVLRCLARGSQATVYLAMDTRLSRRVCIKVYSLQGTLGERRRAVAEAWQLTRVDSPLAVTVYDVVSHGKRLALVTSYVPGCNLEELLDSDQPLSVSSVFAIASDVAAALASVRRAKLVHGDLSARNVLLAGNGRAILADFGVASWAGHAPVGFSQDSTSPEQREGAPADLRSDFFALGLLIYRMLFHAHPFYRAGELDPRLLNRGLREVPALQGADAPARDAIAELLLCLLAADPGSRPSGTFELREQLRVIRAMLPPPENLRPQILASKARRVPIDEPLRLPKRLVRLPYQHHIRAWLLHYWRGGSLGARALLLMSLSLPVILLALFVAQPGPCLLVEPPQLSGPSRLVGAVPGQRRLQELLTTALKSSSSRAWVLGSGKASDSLFSLTPMGIKDVCVAQCSLRLLVACESNECRFQLRSLTPTGSRFSEVTLPASAGLRAIEDAVVQLVHEQAAFLIDY